MFAVVLRKRRRSMWLITKLKVTYVHDEPAIELEQLDEPAIGQHINVQDEITVTVQLRCNYGTASKPPFYNAPKSSIYPLLYAYLYHVQKD